MAGSTFFKMQHELLTSPDFLEFIQTPSYTTWLMLHSRIYRWKPGREQHPIRYPFWAEGWLAAHVSIGQLVAQWLGKRDANGVRRDLADLGERMLAQSYRPDEWGSNPTIYQLGSWRVNQDGGVRRISESLYIDKYFTMADSEIYGDEEDDEPLPLFRQQ